MELDKDSTPTRTSAPPAPAARNLRPELPDAARDDTRPAPPPTTARRASQGPPTTPASYKLRLLASISHELIPPVHSLLARARLLSEDPDHALDPQQAEYVATIASAGGDLLTLVNEIVDLATVDDGAITVAPRDVRLPEIIDAVDRSFRPLAAAKQLSYTTELRVGLPAGLHTDPRRLQQVLLDLLANALRFTEQGSITLRIHRPDPSTRFSNAALEARVDVIAFSVIDTGMGIAATAPHPDLSLSRQVARLLGGEIHLEDEGDADRGIRFTLYLPERTTAEGAGAVAGREGRAARPAQPRAAPGRKLLIIDDDVRGTFTLTGALEERGHAVIYADGLQDGLDALSREPDVDVVLIDLETSCTDRYAPLRLLRAEPALRRKPIVAIGYPAGAPVTADAVARHREACLDAGASHYLPKPIDTGDLLELIRIRPTDSRVRTP